MRQLDDQMTREAIVREASISLQIPEGYWKQCDSLKQEKGR